MSKEHKQVYSGSKLTFGNTSGDVSKFRVDINGNLVVAGNLNILGDLESTDVTQSTLQIDDKSIILNRGEVGPGVGATPGTAPLSGIVVDRGMYEQTGDFVNGEPVYEFRADPYTPATMLWNEDIKAWDLNTDLDALDLDGNPNTSVEWQDRFTWENPRIVNVGNPEGNHRTSDLDIDPYLKSTVANVGWVANITNPIEVNIDNIEAYINTSQSKTTNHIMYWKSQNGVSYGGYWEARELRMYYDKSPTLGEDIDTNGYQLSYFGNYQDTSESSPRTTTYSTLYLGHNDAADPVFANTTLWANASITIESETAAIDLNANTAIGITAPAVNVISTDVTNAVVNQTNTVSGTFLVNGTGNAVIAPAGTVTIKDFTMPLADGTANQAIVTDGAGNLSFSDTILESTRLSTARNINVSGAVTGSALFDGTSDITITTTATSDPTITLSGDVSGSGTLTNLGNVTIAVTVADDSHNHIIANVDGLQLALDGLQTSIDSKVDPSITLTAGDGLDGGGDLSTNRTFSVDATVIRNSGNQTITGTLTAGDTISTTGGLAIQGLYSGNNRLLNLGSMFSSGATMLGYGVRSSTSQIATFLSTASNSTFVRGALTFDSELVFYNAPAQATAIGDPVTMTERFRVAANGVISGNGAGLTSVNAATLSSLNSSQFLRSDTDDTMTGNLTVTGEVSAGSYDTNSALKYKDDVVDFNNALEKVLKISTIYYTPKGNVNTRKIGVTAESLAKVAPEFVKFKDGEPDAVNYGQMTAMLIRAIQEQEERRLINRVKRLFTYFIGWFK